MNPAAITSIATPPNFAANGINVACVAGVTFCHISVDENGRTGSETTVIYEGNYIPIKNQQAFCRNTIFYNMGLTRIDASTRYRLTVTYPFDENGREPLPILGTYELDIEQDQPSVFQNPVLRTFLPDNYIALVARVCSNFEAGDYSMTTTAGGVSATDGGWAAAIKDLKAGISDPYYQARCIQLFSTVCAYKTDAYIEDHTIFRRNLTAASPTQVQASREGAGMIWTTREVEIWEDINPNGWFQLDPAAQWLKSKPNVIASAAQKTTVTYTYKEFKQGNGLLYLPYGAAQLLYASVSDLPPGVPS